MIHYPRPTAPPGFPDIEVTLELHLVRTAIHGTGVVEWNEEIWKRHIRAFQEAQHHKCCWCEADTRAHSAPIEHRAPKGRVDRLVTTGTEAGGYSAVSFVDRRMPELHPIGYWWLAYAWSNWALSCERCNAWKRCLYPIVESPHPRPEEAGTVTPLLLDPFASDASEVPERHLAFDTAGQVRGLSDKGLATIDTCGLDRPSLVQMRAPVADQAARLCDRILRPGPVSREATEDMQRLCRPERSYAGVARSITHQELGISWTELEGL